MRTRTKLLQDIQHFLSLSGMNDGEFGWKSCRNSSLVDNLERGKDVTTGTMDRIYDFIDQNFNLTQRKD